MPAPGWLWPSALQPVSHQRAAAGSFDATGSKARLTCTVAGLDEPTFGRDVLSGPSARASLAMIPKPRARSCRHCRSIDGTGGATALNRARRRSLSLWPEGLVDLRGRDP